MSLKVSNIQIAGVQTAMYGCRLSHGSEKQTDSDFFTFGDKDLGLAKRLYKAGDSHSAFLRQIQVWFRLKAPVYFWKHWDKYKWVNRLENEIEERSESTMHGILKEPITNDDFARPVGKVILDGLNKARMLGQFEQLINCLPQGYMQERQINTNLSVLLRMVEQRKNHRLIEWQDFIKQIREKKIIDYFLDL